MLDEEKALIKKNLELLHPGLKYPYCEMTYTRTGENISETIHSNNNIYHYFKIQGNIDYFYELVLPS